MEHTKCVKMGDTLRPSLPKLCVVIRLISPQQCTWSDCQSSSLISQGGCLTPSSNRWACSVFSKVGFFVLSPKNSTTLEKHQRDSMFKWIWNSCAVDTHRLFVTCTQILKPRHLVGRWYRGDCDQILLNCFDLDYFLLQTNIA